MRRIDVKSIVVVLSTVLICSLIAFAEPQNNDSNIPRPSEQTIIKPVDSNDINHLIAALKNEDLSIRIKAIESLGRTRDIRAADALVSQLNDIYIFSELSETLRKMGKFSVRSLNNALTNENSYVRWRAAQVLGMIGDSNAVEPLIAALRDKDSVVSWAAAEALGEIRDVRAVEPLIVVLKNQDSFLSTHATMALGKIGDKRGC